MRRHLWRSTAVLVCVVICGCGQPRSDTATTELGSTSSQSAAATDGPHDTVVEAGEVVVGSGMLLQRSADTPAELCVGGVDMSYPPQCAGPSVVGDVPWDAMRPEHANGVTWSTATVWAVGRLDLELGPSGSLTLERPLGLTPPPGVAVPTQSAPTFRQLCIDPYAGGGRAGGGSSADRDRLLEQLDDFDGYIGSWVSDGSSMLNVLVRGDASQARTELRRTWRGGLCIEQRNAPTQKSVRAAQEALGSRVQGMLSSGASNGRLDVEVTLLDRPTLDLIHAMVRPWLRPSDIRVTSAFRPLPD